MILALLVGSLLLLGSAYAWWHFVEHRFTTVASGKFYRSAAMPPARLRGFLRRQGIRTVIDLRTPGEGLEKIGAERAVVEGLGRRFVNLPSPQVPGEAELAVFLDLIARPENLPILVHCNHGEGRAVLYGALWRIEAEGWQGEAARKSCRVLTTRGSSFDARKSKGAFLRAYVARGLPR
jgi:protein tyrosine/serine phosphatase